LRAERYVRSKSESLLFSVSFKLIAFQDDVQQYGVQAVDCSLPVPTPNPSISNNASIDIDVRFKPVMFWFYRSPADARVVFCAPTIAGFNVKASASLNNGELVSVQELNNYTTDNDVFGGTNQGKAFNAVVFNQTSNRFIAARGSATNTGIPGTIFRAANQNKTQDAFTNPNGFLDLTSKVYVSIAIYFCFQISQLTSTLTLETTPRLDSKIHLLLRQQSYR